MDFFYPEGVRSLFTNRRKELKTLDFYLEQHLRGIPQHTTLFGPRRIGKTLLIKEWFRQLLSKRPEILPIYIDFEDITSSPETFASGYLGMCLYWLWEHGNTSPFGYFSPLDLLIRAKTRGPQVAHEMLTDLLRELEKQKPDRLRLLQFAFGFPELLGQATGKKVVLCLDEFQTLVNLSNYPECKNVVAVFRGAMEKQSRVSYLLAGSAITVMNQIVAEHQSPLFGQFNKIVLRGFDERDTAELASKLFPGLKGNQAILRELFHLSAGHPFYIRQLCSRAQLLHERDGLPFEPGLIRIAFVLETLSTEGKIYDFCRYQYDISLEKARGFAALQQILRLLALEEGQTASTLAKKLRVAYSTVGNYLRSLLDVDLLREREKRYYFVDPVLRYWLLNINNGIEIEDWPSEEILEDLLRRLQEQFQAVSTELGVSKEAEVRELMRKFAGQEIEGQLLGREGVIVLPRFTEVTSFSTADGQVELECLGIGEERWAVQVKWRQRAAGLKEVKALVKVAQMLNAKPWLISKGGFTEGARAECQRLGVFFSGAGQLKRLAGLLSKGVRGGFGP
ncbi:MAG: AAA family ATPase [Firmicutes bacterium]|nr:AAA family ATPase [Bacillota bacterium]